MKKPEIKESLLAPGHKACAGCGEALAARIIMDAAGPNTIVLLVRKFIRSRCRDRGGFESYGKGERG